MTLTQARRLVFALAVIVFMTVAACIGLLVYIAYQPPL